MKLILSNRYYKKILIALLTVNIIPFLWIFVSVYNLASNQKQSMDQAMLSNLDSKIARTETTFHYVENAMIRMTLSANTAKGLRTEFSAPNFQIINALQSELQLIGNSELQLEDIFLVNFNKDWIIGTTDRSKLSDYSQLEALKPLIANSNHSFWYADEHYLYLAKRLPIYTTPGQGMLIARFYKNMLDMDAQGEDGRQNARLVVVEQNGTPVYGDELYGTIVKGILSLDQRQILSGEQTETIEYMGKKYTFVSRESDYNRWRYVLMVEGSDYGKSVAQLFFSMSVAAVLALLLNMVIIYLNSKDLYMPIHQVNELVEKSLAEKENVESGRDLEYNIKQLLYDNANMQKALHSRENSWQQLFLRRLYRGEENHVTEEFLLKEKILPHSTDGCILYAMAVAFKDDFVKEEDWKLYMFVLDNVVSELIDQRQRFPVVPMGKVLYDVCVLEADSHESADLKMQTMTTTILTAVKRYVNMTVNIGISSGFTDVGEIPNHVRQSERALREAAAFDGICNFYQKNKDNLVSRSNQIIKNRTRVLQAIDKGDREAGYTALNEYMYHLIGLKYYLFKMEVCQMVSEILKYYEKYMLEPDYEIVTDILDYDISRKISSADTLRSYLWDYLLNPLYESICDKAEQKDIIHQIVAYIDEHIEEELNLEECANEFHYNANYLSRMFKKRLGKTFTDYVIEKKMELCKNLLKNTDISVNDLAKQFGYSSTQNFIRVFKKYALYTPGQFRKLVQEEKEKEPEQDD